MALVQMHHPVTGQTATVPEHVYQRVWKARGWTLPSTKKARRKKPADTVTDTTPTDEPTTED